MNSFKSKGDDPVLIYKTLENFTSSGTAITVGKFDGVHIGHRKLLDVLMAEKGDLEACVFTFDIRKGTGILENDNRICSEEEKEKILEKIGIQKLVLFPFDKETASIPARDFVEKILCKKLCCKLLVVGDDFRFGKDRKGDIDLLKQLSSKLGFRLIVVKREEFEGAPVSSSRIREALKDKNFKTASAMLGEDDR